MKRRTGAGEEAEAVGGRRTQTGIVGPRSDGEACVWGMRISRLGGLRYLEMVQAC